jgi:LPS sulfotransferase NodH
LHASAQRQHPVVQALGGDRCRGESGLLFSPSSISDWLADLGVTRKGSVPERELLEAIFRTAIAKGTLNTDIFGLRLQRDSFHFFTEKLGVLYPEHSNDFERFQAAFGRTFFVHLTRRDKVAQAVSYVKAQQTGLWHAAPDGTELERLSPPQEPAYDASEIRTRLEEVTAHDHGWEYWFASSEIAPLRITYEELSDGPVETLRVILDHLGLEGETADGVELGVAKLADNINQDWVARFRSEQKPTP